MNTITPIKLVFATAVCVKVANTMWLRISSSCRFDFKSFLSSIHQPCLGVQEGHAGLNLTYIPNKQADLDRTYPNLRLME